MKLPARTTCRHCGRSICADSTSISHQEPTCEGFLTDLEAIARELGLKVEDRGPHLRAIVPEANSACVSTHDVGTIKFVCNTRGQA